MMLPIGRNNQQCYITLDTSRWPK